MHQAHDRPGPVCPTGADGAPYPGKQFRHGLRTQPPRAGAVAPAGGVPANLCALPHNAAWHQAVQAGQYPPPFLEDLKTLAREEGLWNLLLPGLRDDEPGTRMDQLFAALMA